MAIGTATFTPDPNGTTQFQGMFAPFFQQSFATNPVNVAPVGSAPTLATPAVSTVASNIPGGAPNELSPARGAASGESRIDPRLAPYLQMGLQRAERLFFGNEQPGLYPGQMYVDPSQQTLRALATQEQLATEAAPVLSNAQQAYLNSLGQVGQTAAGGFLQGNPYQQAMLAAAQRPLVQQYSEQVVPGIASLYSRAGRYGSGAMERALGTSTEAFGRAIGDVSANIVGRDYANERSLMQQAQMGQAALAQAAPSFFQASFLPAQALAQVGAAQEQIAQRPLTEAIQRYQFSQQLPYQQLQGFLSSVYGTPMGSSQIPQPQPAQTNQFGQALGGATLGYALSGGNPYAAGFGGLLGYFG